MVLLYGGTSFGGGSDFGTGTTPYNSSFNPADAVYGSYSGSLPFGTGTASNPTYYPQVGGSLTLGGSPAPVLPIYQQPAYQPQPQTTTTIENTYNPPTPMGFPTAPQLATAPAATPAASFVSPSPLAPLPQAASNSLPTMSNPYANPTLAGGVSYSPSNFALGQAQMRGGPSQQQPGQAPQVSNGGGGNLPGAMGMHGGSMSAPPMNAQATQMPPNAMASVPKSNPYGMQGNQSPAQGVPNRPAAGAATRGQALQNGIPPAPPTGSELQPPPPAVPLDPQQAALAEHFNNATARAARNHDSLKTELEQAKDADDLDTMKAELQILLPTLRARRDFEKPMDEFGGKSRLELVTAQIGNAMNTMVRSRNAVNAAGDILHGSNDRAYRNAAADSYDRHKKANDILAKQFPLNGALNEANNLDNRDRMAAGLRQADVNARMNWAKEAADITTHTLGPALEVYKQYQDVLAANAKATEQALNLRKARQQAFTEAANIRIKLAEDLTDSEKIEAQLYMSGLSQMRGQAHEAAMEELGMRANGIANSKYELDKAVAYNKLGQSQDAAVTARIHAINESLKSVAASMKGGNSTPAMQQQLQNLTTELGALTAPPEPQVSAAGASK